jgi:nicotinate-nucleotide pyrophosphorylase (carboxylating)
VTVSVQSKGNSTKKKGGRIKKRRAFSAKEKRAILSIVRRAIKEDLGKGDITTDPIVPPDRQALAIIFPKQDGILCGIDFAEMVFREIDKNIDYQRKIKDGSAISPGETLATIIGSAAACLKGERTALNILQHLSGIATLTREYVSASENLIKILDTRKTLPGLRVMEKYAVRIGGGHNHRFGLYDMVLIKDNHIEIAGGITPAVQAIRGHAEHTFIEVEVRSSNELEEALSLQVDRIMLDNMNAHQIKEAVKMIRERSDTIEIEVSGGITIRTVKEIAESGIDLVSVGALTHSAPAIDISMKIKLLE